MRTSIDIEQNIAKLEAEIAPIEEQLGVLMEKISIEMGTLAKAWILKHASSAVEANAEKITSAGPDLVRDFKAAVNSAAEGAHARISDAMDDRSSWPHINPESRATSSYGNNDDYFENLYRHTVSSLGEVLQAHGMIDNRAPMREWQNYGSQVRYAYHTGFDARNIPALQKYSEVRKQHSALARELDADLLQLPKVKAREIYDNS